MDIIITPGTLRGTLEAPPSKSHAHRLMTAVALAGKKNSESLCTSEDTRATFRCLNELQNSSATADCRSARCRHSTMRSEKMAQ